MASPIICYQKVGTRSAHNCRSTWIAVLPGNLAETIDHLDAQELSNNTQELSTDETTQDADACDENINTNTDTDIDTDDEDEDDSGHDEDSDSELDELDDPTWVPPKTTDLWGAVTTKPYLPARSCQMMIMMRV